MSDIRVVSVAHRIAGVIVSKPSPARHPDILYVLEDHGIPKGTPDDQGFLLSNGEYATRREAYKIAMAAGQVLYRRPDGYDGDELFSEDVW